MAARKNPTMGNMTKAELVHALQELGEELPVSWTKVELKGRLMHLETEMGIKRGGQKGPTPLQVWVTKLNMVNKKRGTLRTFLVEELGGTAPDSATKDQLNKIALDYIYDRAEVCGSDPVGFGQHAAKTYQEVKIMEPEYCIWVKTTARDSGSIRLLRLAKWLESPEGRQEKAQPPVPKVKAAPPTLRRRERGLGSGSQEPETRVAMQQILVAVRNLQSEVESMKEERRRKKAPEVRPLSKARATFLENEASGIGPQALEALVRKGPTWLIEVACSPSSLLSKEVQQVAGYESAAIRCAHWNGCDLETKAGVAQVIRHPFENEHQPRHVWISTECGPYSPMQSVNQRTEAQKAELLEKRRKVLKQYLGGCAVYQHCMQLGIHATWEWAQKSHAWRLPFIQKLDKKYVPYYAVTQGCQVGLKDPRDDRLMHKGWKIMTSHARLAHTMQMPCTCSHGYHHAKCEGGLAGASAFYTPTYVRRVCRVLQQELGQEGLTRELEGRTSLLSRFGTGHQCVCSEIQSHGSQHTCGACLTAPGEQGHGEPKTEEAMATGLAGNMTDEEIRRKLYLLHASTGHGSTRNLVEALKKRQAPARVVELAEQFECAFCQEKRKIQTKHVASLETLPPKLVTVSADGGRWTHPISHDEIEFVCAIDEGSRFRVTKVLKEQQIS